MYFEDKIYNIFRTVAHRNQLARFGQKNYNITLYQNTALVDHCLPAVLPYRKLLTLLWLTIEDFTLLPMGYSWKPD
jgi:hypothetical protein